ncbi:hypothetical protein E4U54_001358 [Claviceps lovelessii]|nr:hypothetical protein E4U54_001358 [Claviceps lovelessii]
MVSLMQCSYSHALATKAAGSPWHFIHNTEHAPVCGGQNAVHALESRSGYRVAIHVPLKIVFIWDDKKYVDFSIEAELRQRIDRARIAFSQPFLAFSGTVDNPIGCPFLVLGWVDGSPLRWSVSVPASNVERHRVIRAVANAGLDLLRINENRKVTALDWIQSKIRRKMGRV